MEDKPKKKITFFSKNEIICPVCNNSFKREEMFTGGGRLIAGGITPELRRLYEPSKVYGSVNPLLYPVTVCPKCYYAVLKEDFSKIKPNGINIAKQHIERRKGIINRIFGQLNFNDLRTLKHGAASYVLAIESYNYFDKWASPTVKKAISALRAAWLLSDLEVEDPMADYGDLQTLFYRKALQFYNEVLRKQEKAEESFDGIKNLGPDTDHNYGYEGILYLIGYLTMKLSFLEKDSPQKIAMFDNAKKIVSKMVGFGHANKNKPSLIIDMARDLYDELNTKIQELTEKLNGVAQSPPEAGINRPPAET